MHSDASFYCYWSFHEYASATCLLIEILFSASDCCRWALGQTGSRSLTSAFKITSPHQGSRPAEANVSPDRELKQDGNKELAMLLQRLAPTAREDGKAGEVSHTRLNSDNDPAHRSGFLVLARADHFARLFDYVQMVTSYLK